MEYLIKIVFEIKKKLYLITPMCCTFLWIFYYLLHENFIFIQEDFLVLYNAGKQLFIDPTVLYDPKFRFYYLPIFALFFGITFSLFPFFIAQYIFYFTTIILGLLFIREYDEIIKLIGIEIKIHRFIFLMIISNGWFIYVQILFGQFKYIVGVILFFIIRRELQYRREEKEKDLKFYLVNYNLFAFMIAIFIPFIFLFFIYIFQEIHIADVFKKENIRKYSMILLIFAIQNFLFFIYPSYFFDILPLYNRHNTVERNYFPLFYLC